MKVIWHYVEDGDLPEENKSVLISVRGKEEIMIGSYFKAHGWQDFRIDPKICICVGLFARYSTK